MRGHNNAFMNLKKFNSRGPQYPSSTETIDRFHDCGSTLTQLTKIVNNNDDVQVKLDSDEPLQYKSLDGDQSPDDNNDDNNAGNVHGESTLIGVYTGNFFSIAISYLDHTEESTKESKCHLADILFLLVKR
ncbi:hypothetical protein P3L10_024645 [Capsicum annuum]